MSEHEAYGHKDHHALIKGSTADWSGEDPVAWLAEADMLEADFPHAAGMIMETFREWIENGTRLSFAENWEWSLFDYKGRWLADSLEREASDNPLWEQVASVSLLSRRECSLQIVEDGAEKSYMALPVGSRSRGEIFALLGCSMPAVQFSAGGKNAAEAMAPHFRTIFYRRFEYSFISDLASVHGDGESASSHHSLLFQMVQRMHDSIDVRAVLTEVFDSLEAMFPDAELTLYISQDQVSGFSRVKPLPTGWEGDDVRERAFKDGTVSVRLGTGDNEQMEIALPLGGKQGVYGVLHLTQRGSCDVNRELLGMIASTAGTAFENAKLYERSNQLVRELRMSNDLTQRLNQSLRLEDTFEAAFEELMDMFEADYCCILHFNEDKGGLEAVACNHPALANEIIEIGRGLGGKVYETGESMILSDYLDFNETRSKLMDLTDSHSLIATPLSVGGQVRGVIMLSHQQPHFFSYDNYKFLQAVAGHIGLAVGNALLHAEVRRLANRDTLTGLFARHYLDDEIKFRQGNDFCGSLIVVDIDEFKIVNDTYGHQQGDKILKQVSEVIRTSIRGGDVAARWGGEELAIYLPQLGLDQALVVAERVRVRVQQETEPQVTVSCGIADWSWTEERISVESLFYRADMALYEAKNTGRNRVVADRKKAEAGWINP
ncbi:sensor domain-containing diguanylate cyclase [Paenibacillus spiritus]|uniref:Sensor domain-containing diguanylate cyclase n=1 Tax=Paenibacillus spiritus TaxID=2496557 RepID=A0A5J5G8U5_9BACL|nr:MULTISPECIES: sensor domain-containing diguanylate cyclase [Paenibacillus]KAA9004032.1 sensor domain-containing diguanylate cyclase [Paenibacillus spiritus]